MKKKRKDKIKLQNFISAFMNAIKLVWNTNPIFTILLGIVTLGQSIIPTFSAWAAKLIIDTIVGALASHRIDWSIIISPLMFAAGVALAGLVFAIVSQLLNELMQPRLSLYINEMIMRKTMTLNLDFFETPKKLDTLHQALQESNFRPLSILLTSFTLIKQVFTLISICFVLFRFGIWLLLLFIIGVPVLYVQTRFARESFNLAKRRTPLLRKATYYSTIMATSSHVKEIKILKLGKLLIYRYRDLFKKIIGENTSLSLRRAFIGVLFQILGQTMYYAAYIIVILQTLRGQITIGDMTLYSGLLLQAPMITQSLMYAISELFENNLFLNNLLTFLSEKTRLVSILGSNHNFPQVLHVGIDFQHVYFHYPDSEVDVLKDISFSIHPGEKIALVGENGAGKTTLIKLLTRLYEPTAGKIVAESIDLRGYNIDSLHDNISIVFQDFVHYFLTVKENIGFGDINYLEDTTKIRMAAEKSGAHSIICELPFGYDTTLGRFLSGNEDNEGCELSIGQWQKIALARAFMRNAPILVLDEPTSSMDPQAEYDIFGKLKELASDRIVILISHRFSTVRIADRIIVMDNGRISEIGTHSELLLAGGHYARLFNLQAEGYR